MTGHSPALCTMAAGMCNHHVLQANRGDLQSAGAWPPRPCIQRCQVGGVQTWVRLWLPQNDQLLRELCRPLASAPSLKAQATVLLSAG